MRIVLASASPRRRELLGVMGLEAFEVQIAPGPEPDFAGLPPRERVMEIARSKARRCAEALEDRDALVIGADTLVFTDEGALGKPRDAADAARMLVSLAGRTHQVVTGVAVLQGDREALAAETTAVRFAPLTAAEIAAYVATGEPMDKAGAYGIQGRGSVLIEGIDGDYFNVMGLPIRRVYEILRDFGMDVLGTERDCEETV